MRSRLAAALDGAGWAVGLAAVLFVFALLVVLLDLQSPDAVLWTGHHVTGTEQGGIVSYRWQGQNYSLDVPGYGSSKAVNVYLDPGNPSDAMVNNLADRAAVASLVGVPLIAGVAVLAIGLTRQRRWRRRQMRQDASPPGGGLDPDYVAQYLRKLRGDDGNTR
jgi:hypothetical protein